MCAVTEPLTALFESNETLSQRVQDFLCSRFVFLLWFGPSIQGFFFPFDRFEGAIGSGDGWIGEGNPRAEQKTDAF